VEGRLGVVLIFMMDGGGRVEARMIRETSGRIGILGRSAGSRKRSS
jgi:hypothetical protein